MTTLAVLPSLPCSFIAGSYGPENNRSPGSQKVRPGGEHCDTL